MAWFKNGKEPKVDEKSKQELGIHWVAQLENETFRTPAKDVNYFERHPWQLLFLYGEDLPGTTAYDELIKPYIYCSPASAFTVDHFTVYENQFDATPENNYPVALDVKHFMVPHTHIKGKLVLIRSKQLYELDKYRHNGLSFVRRKVHVIGSFTRYQWTKAQGNLPPERYQKKFRASMYVGIPEFWDEHIDAGYSSVPVHQTESKAPWIGDYIDYERHICPF